MRVYPQDQNTGGFFIAVIKKTAEMPLKAPTQSDATEAEKEPSPATTAEDDEAEPVVIDPALKHLVKEIAGKELRAAREGETTSEGGEAKEGEEEAPESRRRKDKRWGKEEPFLPLTETMRAEWLAAKYAPHQRHVRLSASLIPALTQGVLRHQRRFPDFAADGTRRGRSFDLLRIRRSEGHPLQLCQRPQTGTFKRSSSSSSSLAKMTLVSLN